MGQSVAADWPPDEAIVSRFREWIVAQTEAQALSARVTADNTPEQAAFETACDRIPELVGMIADLPSRGPAGLAVKSYLRYHNAHPGDYGSRPETLGELGMDAGSTCGDLEVSIIADAVRFVPELAPLAAAVIGPAEKAAA